MSEVYDPEESDKSFFAQIHEFTSLEEVFPLSSQSVPVSPGEDEELLLSFLLFHPKIIEPFP